ncbi:MAG: trimethylamine methyltransferase family protein [Anaerolineales bacterium]|jgi:trimethylamine--corrinoid protein Co-methyltransferase
MDKTTAGKQSPHFSVLSEGQCQELYNVALECLERVGVNVYNIEGRQLLEAAGAGADGILVKIPRNIIQRAVEQAPNSFELWDREGVSSLRVAPHQNQFGPGPSCTYLNDPLTGERRRARRGDAGLTAKVCDALENIDFVMSLSLYDDVTPALSPVYEFADMITNTRKPIAAWANNIETLKAIYEIATCVRGDERDLIEKPNLIYFSTYHSPLQHLDEKTATILWAADKGIPVVYLGGPTVGIEAPITAASGLVIYLASALSGLAMVQLKHPGAPMAIGGLPMVMDMFTARPAYGSPEMCLNTAAAAELAYYLNLPFMGTAGSTESKLLDAQAGAEITAQTLMAGLSGAGLVHDIGFLDCADIGSLELLVLSNEVIGYVKRILRGINVDQKSIMLELIEKVGPGGYFISEPASAKLCRQEVWVPVLSDRLPYTQWKDTGGFSMEDRVRLRLVDILNHHNPPELSQEVLERIHAILEEEEIRVSAMNNEIEI